MADDIDELLQELEEKYLQKNQNKIITSVSSTSKTSESLDLDEILKIETDDYVTDRKFLQVPVHINTVDYLEKCFPVCLGGSNAPTGCSRFGKIRCCSDLHCTSCDFKVYQFLNYTWRSDTDYLFLRCHMPNFEKLKQQLVVRDKCRAFSCQCTHYSTEHIVDVYDVKHLAWICKGHVTNT